MVTNVILGACRALGFKLSTHDGCDSARLVIPRGNQKRCFPAPMRAMESEMQCKVRKGGLHEDRRTGEMIYSKFFHRDSRPIDGLSDPHWHVHCFIHNAI
jgi:hypothetical protein